MTFYVVYNPERENCLLGITQEMPEVTPPLVMKGYSGDIPDMSRFFWNSSMLSFDAKPVRRLSKLEFISRFGGTYANVLTAAKSSVDVEMFVRMLDWAGTDKDGTSIDLDDPRVAYALGQMEVAGILPPGTADGVLA